VLVKLEKPAAIGRLDEIVELTDAVMVARGDLGCGDAAGVTCRRSRPHRPGEPHAGKP